MGVRSNPALADIRPLTAPLDASLFRCHGTARQTGVTATVLDNADHVITD
jgi:hypothetical protein